MSDQAKPSRRELWGCAVWVLGEGWRHRPWFYLFAAIETLVQAAWPFVNILIFPLIVAELTGGRDGPTLFRLAAAIVAGNFLCHCLTSLCSQQRGKYADEFSRHFQRLLSARAMSMDFRHTENPDVLNQAERARTGMTWYSGGVNGLCECFMNVGSAAVRLVGTAVLISLQAPLMIPVALLAIAACAVMNAKMNGVQMRYFLKLATTNRRFGYVFWELSDFRFGKDVRLYDAAPMLLEKAVQTADECTANWRAQATESRRYSYGDSLFAALRDAVVVLYLGFLVLRRAIDIAGFSQLTGAGAQFSDSLGRIIRNVQDIDKRCQYSIEFVKFMSMEDAMRSGTRPVAGDAGVCEGGIAHRIEFRNVTFSYPGAKTPSLKNFSLSIAPGERLSLVGLNGAGKTTFVKLLCRLYDPDSGAILLDGVDIREYDYGEYLALFSVVFQDFRLFAFPIRDNIAPGESLSDADGMDLARRVGLDELLAKPNTSLDTPVFRQFDEAGFEPSGGEQQKIAIARALRKDAPVIVLDEPTAALDPLAEAEIYRHFDTLTGGKTAVYISHRLSSCQFCDRIAVIADGAVAECGTHQELVSVSGGLYAQMFAAQAQYYMEDV